MDDSPTGASAGAGGGLALFDTSVGRCGIAWSEVGIAAVQLPEESDGVTRARLARRVPGARESRPPAHVRGVIERIRALLRGEPDDLADVVLDLHGIPPFDARVYDAARRIGPGCTLTYGEVARRLGEPGAARAVGGALGRNPFTLIVPCHRVVAANAKAGGFSARGGAVTKLRLLGIEGAHLRLDAG